MTIGFGASCTPSPISLATMSFEQKTGKVLAHMGHDACPTWASTLPRLGRFYAKRLPKNVLMTDRAFEIKRPALPEEERQGNLCQKIRSLL